MAKLSISLRTFCCLLTTALLLTYNTASSAQDSAFDELSLNGLAAFEQLRKEYYIGGLYLESLDPEAGASFNFSSKKRMEIRITIEKWSPRRFAQQWNQLILINNDQETLNNFSDQILAFTDIPKKGLTTGDIITIDLDPGTGTSIYLNGSKAFEVNDNAFFDILLNTWVGQRPPSSDFKDHILTLPTDQAGTELLTRFENLSIAPGRQKMVAAWFKPKQSKPEKPVEDEQPLSAAIAAGPPSLDTAVTAKRTTEPADKTPAKKSIAVAQPTLAIPKPKIDVSQPTLAVNPGFTSPPATPGPVPNVPEKPKKEPIATATPDKTVNTKPAANEQPEIDDEQNKLLSIYRSNVLKLTYLNTQYPERALNFKQQGVVVLKVKINRQGQVLEILEETMSKYKLLNNAARRAVKKTAPYPKVPKNLTGSEIEVSLPFNFKI